jgi:type II secretory pathway pseudopilin PulG
MRNRATERGLTLIEILIAIIIMTLGVLGILSLFPPALQSATESVEETNAAILGESVAHALTAGFRTAIWNMATSKWEVSLTHDLQVGKSTKGRYTFTLPPLPVDPIGVDLAWRHYPSTSQPPPVDPGMELPAGGYDPEGDDRLFKLGGDGWTRATVKNVHDVNDPTDPYTQFAFSFDIRKVNTLAHLRKQKNPATGKDYTEKELDGMAKLYEIRVHLFRTTGGKDDFLRLITVITKRISAR